MEVRNLHVSTALRCKNSRLRQPSVYSGLSDIILALLPWSIVWKLQMKPKEKIGVAIAMSMGVLYVSVVK